MDEQKKKSQKKRSVIPIYAIGAVWLLYAGKLDTFRGIVSCAVVSAIVYGILRIVLRGKKTDTPEEAPAAAPEPQPAKPEPQPQPEADKLPPELQSVIYQGKTSIAKIRQLNDEIPDEEMTDKISRLEAVSTKIFEQAKADPDKLPQMRKFMDYYLPTSLKLLNTYAELDKQGIEGENISESKHRIEQTMDTLVKAFENQLDRLFASDALDVSTDIDVMQNMLRADGLTDDAPFKL